MNLSYFSEAQPLHPEKTTPFAILTEEENTREIDKIRMKSETTRAQHWNWFR